MNILIQEVLSKSEAREQDALVSLAAKSVTVGAPWA
jgi:hypothetical protein